MRTRKGWNATAVTRLAGGVAALLPLAMLAACAPSEVDETAAPTMVTVSGSLDVPLEAPVGADSVWGITDYLAQRVYVNQESDYRWVFGDIGVEPILR